MFNLHNGFRNKSENTLGRLELDSWGPVNEGFCGTKSFDCGSEIVSYLSVHRQVCTNSAYVPDQPGYLVRAIICTYPKPSSWVP